MPYRQLSNEEREVMRRLEELPEEARRVALWKLEGYTNEEIAGKSKMDCAVRTVERKLAQIRKQWEKSLATAAMDAEAAEADA